MLQQDPCLPSPCGPNSQCRNMNGQPSCSCLSSYKGSPPNCRPECTINAECPTHLVCLNEKCTDPCSGLCGYLAQCSIVNHIPICSCPDGFTGDPFTICNPQQIPPPIQIETKCKCFEFPPPLANSK